MIDRYSLSPMKELWTQEAKYQRWLEVELTVVDALAELGQIPKEAANTIHQKVKLNAKRAKEIEDKIGHDLLAFVRSLEESVGPEGRFIHRGLTSYDVVDTALSLTIRQALEILNHEMGLLLQEVKKLALEHRHTIMVGRTHGMHAEPITFGLKLLIWYAELQRGLQRLAAAQAVISTGKISGSVGTYANVDPEVEQKVCAKLNLQPALVSNQLLQRDRHAQVLTTLAIVAGTLEKMAVEIRNLHRTEIGEVREGAPHGSSSMPHKQNPSTSETISGLARLVRLNALAALENMPVWHEQDLTRSSIERIIIPDSFLVTHYMLRSMTKVIASLRVNFERMKENLESSRGVVYSQAVLLKLIDKGMLRMEAHELIRARALEVEATGKHLKECLAGDKKVRTYLSPEELDELFDVQYHLKHVDVIFGRFFD
ncbi:MAG: adenylosuccinate lyase [Candidatus Fraserbacteria bacterium RBG_16_55_9]|uniref:Adenylosuccinate lyase n=1 Tax=Fraserbacteria sp. (strain RBG_16_55_9) TaxID=1817864 RepID=A0A1F5V228_FRAXR|nr:MAG: adenylosuccinate lyase [Candidatus Fraserbacteria bacterium RBG_16_55_9]